ncbi:hypothetical protein EDC01DRAFT_791982 [Geopyxis carbonaria]|nr:hypothetical protein EDC01DRAFT_791982 [Geopyxis carbonaria]
MSHNTSRLEMTAIDQGIDRDLREALDAGFNMQEALAIVGDYWGEDEFGALPAPEDAFGALPAAVLVSEEEDEEDRARLAALAELQQDPTPLPDSSYDMDDSFVEETDLDIYCQVQEELEDADQVGASDSIIDLLDQLDVYESPAEVKTEEEDGENWLLLEEASIAREEALDELRDQALEEVTDDEGESPIGDIAQEDSDGEMEDVDPPSSMPAVLEQTVTRSCGCDCGSAIKALLERVNALEQGNEELKAILRETASLGRNQRTRIKTLELNHQNLKDSLRESAIRKVRFSKIPEEHRIEMSNAHVRARKPAKSDKSREHRALQDLEIAMEQPLDGLTAEEVRERCATLPEELKTFEDLQKRPASGGNVAVADKVPSTAFGKGHYRSDAGMLPRKSCLKRTSMFGRERETAPAPVSEADLPDRLDAAENQERLDMIAVQQFSIFSPASGGNVAVADEVPSTESAEDTTAPLPEVEFEEERALDEEEEQRRLDAAELQHQLDAEEDQDRLDMLAVQQFSIFAELERSPSPEPFDEDLYTDPTSFGNVAVADDVPSTELVEDTTAPLKEDSEDDNADNVSPTGAALAVITNEVPGIELVEDVLAPVPDSFEYVSDTEEPASQAETSAPEHLAAPVSPTSPIVPVAPPTPPTPVARKRTREERDADDALTGPYNAGELPHPGVKRRKIQSRRRWIPIGE